MRNITKRLFALLCLSISIALISNAYGQSDTSDRLAGYYINFAAPDLTAGNLLGLSNSQIFDVSSMKKFQVAATTLANTGIGNGFAAEWAPGYNRNLIFSKSGKVILKEKSITNRLSISGGYVPGNKDSSRIAFGFRVLIIDKADISINSDYLNELYEVLKSGSWNEKTADKLEIIIDYLNPKFAGKDPLFCRELGSAIANQIGISQQTGDNVSEFIKKRKEDFLISNEDIIKINESVVYFKNKFNEMIDKPKDDIYSKITEIRKEYQYKLWNAPRFEVRGGQRRLDYSGTSSDFRSDYSSFYAIYSGRLQESDRKYQITGQARYDIWSKTSNSNINSSLSFGGRLLILLDKTDEDGNKEVNNRLSIDYQRSWTDYKDKGMTPDFQWTVGYQSQIQPGTWVEFALGKGGEWEKAPTGLIAKTGIKYAFMSGKEMRFNR